MEDFQTIATAHTEDKCVVFEMGDRPYPTCKDLQSFFPQSLSLNSWNGKAISSTLCHPRTALQKQQSWAHCRTNKNHKNYIESPTVKIKEPGNLWVIVQYVWIFCVQTTCHLCWLSAGLQSTEVNQNKYPWDYGLCQFNTIQHFQKLLKIRRSKASPELNM